MDTGRLSSRRATVDVLAAQPLDVLVIGAGITGTSIAHEAASRGLKTALVDRGDIAGRGHMQSNPLVAIGPRSPGQKHLRQSFQASRALHKLRNAAPHLVRRTPFIYPVYRHAKVAPWRLAWVVGMDAILSSFRNVCQHRLLGKRAMSEREPLLRDPGLIGGVLFQDVTCDKERLTVATARAAARHDALIATYTLVEKLELRDGGIREATVRDLRGNTRGHITAGVVINAAGAWADDLRRLEAPDASPLFQLYRATQIVVPQGRLGARHALRLQSPLDDRMLFMLPAGDRVVLGTAETPVDHPSAVEPTGEEIAYLVRSANAYFPNAHLTPEDIHDIRTAVWPSPVVASGEGSSGDAGITTGRYGMVTVAGAFPYHETVAREVVDLVAGTLGEPGQSSPTEAVDDRILPGGEAHDYAPLQPPGLELGLPAATVDRLIALYGTESAAVYNLVRERRDLMTPLHPHHPAIGAEVVHCARREFVTTVEDVLSRRLHLRAETEDGGRQAAALVAVLMGSELGWDQERVRAEAASYGDGGS